MNEKIIICSQILNQYPNDIISIILKMKLRKKRNNFQTVKSKSSLHSNSCCHSGISNHPQTYALRSNLSARKQTFIEGHKIQRKSKRKATGTIKLNEMGENKRKIIEKIRQQYRNKNNIKKIIKGWKFENKGYLSVKEFHQKLNHNLGINATLDECEAMLRDFSSFGKSFLDTQGFLNLIYQSPESNILNNQLYDPSDQCLRREMKISNLIDKMEFYCLEQKKKHIYEMDDHEVNDLLKVTRRNSIKLRSSKDNPDEIRQIREKMSGKEQKALQIVENQLKMDGGEEHKKIEEEIYNCLLKGNKKREKVFQRIRDGEFMNESMYFSTKNFKDMNSKMVLRRKKPESAILCNKRTRFNATPEKNQLILGQDKGQFSPTKTFELVKLEDNFMKDRYQAKLKKIRSYKSIQKENIRKIDEVKQQVDKANLTRKRLDREAYSYAAFIQNKWQ